VSVDGWDLVLVIYFNYSTPYNPPSLNFFFFSFFPNFFGFWEKGYYWDFFMYVTTWYVEYGIEVFISKGIIYGTLTHAWVGCEGKGDIHSPTPPL
jgi:hypothetical protein